MYRCDTGSPGAGRAKLRLSRGLPAWPRPTTFSHDDSIFKITPSWTCEMLLNFRGNKQMPTEKKAPSKRELIEPTKGDKRFVRRKADGTFGKTVDVGKSLAADRKHSAKTKVPKGQGDRGDVNK
jgi:hypothetical protein